MWPKLEPTDLEWIHPFAPAAPDKSGSSKNFRGFVFFDAGSVLLDLDWDSFFARIPALHPNPQEFDFQAFNRRLAALDLQRKWCTGAIGPATYARMFRECMGLPPTLDPTTGPSLLDIKAASSLIVGPVRPRVLRLVKALRQANFGLGVLSNATPWHETDVEQTLCLRDNFDVVIFSQDYGCEKPEHTIYELAASEARRFVKRKLGIPLSAHDTYFVDDTPANVHAATEAGWQARLVCLLKSELLARAKTGSMSAADLAEFSAQSAHLVSGDEAAKRVEALFAPLLAPY